MAEDEDDVLELGEEHRVRDDVRPGLPEGAASSVDAGRGDKAPIVEDAHQVGLSPLESIGAAAEPIDLSGRDLVEADTFELGNDARMDAIVVTDHALIQWLETVHGVDMAAARRALADGAGRDPTEAELVTLLERHIDLEPVRTTLRKKLDGCKVETDAEADDGRCNCIDDHGTTFVVSRHGDVPYLLTVIPPQG